MVTFRRCIFKKNKARGGGVGAVYVSALRHLPINMENMSLRRSFFLYLENRITCWSHNHISDCLFNAGGGAVSIVASRILVCLCRHYAVCHVETFLPADQSKGYPTLLALWAMKWLVLSEKKTCCRDQREGCHLILTSTKYSKLIVFKEKKLPRNLYHPANLKVVPN